MSNNKSYMFVKKNVSVQEYKIHSYVYNLGLVNVPKIYDYDEDTKVLKMQKIPNMCIADFFGEDADSMPDEIFTKMRDTIKTLYEHNVEYPDITGYNFIENDGKLWIIDFGHAVFNSQINTNIKNEFINKFINGYNGWNPEFY